MLTFNLKINDFNDENEFENNLTTLKWKNNNFKMLQLPHRAFQLKPFKIDQLQNKVFVQTKKSLLLADTNEVLFMLINLITFFSQVF